MSQANVETIFVMKNGQKVEVKLRPISADELKRREEERISAAIAAEQDGEAFAAAAEHAAS